MKSEKRIFYRKLWGLILPITIQNLMTALVSASYLFLGFSQIYLCIMKNSGRTARSTVYGSVAVVINIVFNAVFIFGLAGIPAMGIAGAALAITVSRAIEFLLTFYENTKRSLVGIRVKYIRHSSAKLRKDFWHYTSPILGNELKEPFLYTV